MTAFLGLGSNLGDRKRWLEEALRKLAGLPSTQAVRTSSVYETEPWGGVPQPQYLNVVVEVRTGLSPEELLDGALAVERALGRVRAVRWGPRTIDVDLLWMDGQERSTDRLILPHPRLVERAFVLVPLAELEPDLIVHGRSVGAWLSRLPEDARDGEVRRVGGPMLPERAGPSGLDEPIHVEHEDGGPA
ncbi:2-amino-4-hydroxy-6-hydroxymethyldihydropteridine pyrophosphokinase [Limnochorda pilosa]|uniref:2-amino-4-hydroxy-6-hydroxymethyldihydropteridine diphosphokinase n=1 Tax=Limnochorda pilosa TaxID=1555112 RepID=A0A0K2SPB9_LIMPI|nr:2-amino-4-hydroxy-6-hydroxymethyldihydropteridine pyrophosphokinase [Limnochorda pilosa]